MKQFLFKILLIGIFAAAVTAAQAEEEPQAALPIVINGDRVEYDQINKKVKGKGNVSITYKDIKITCDEIVVDIDKKEAVAGGGITLYQEGNVFKADNVIYNFENKTGKLIHGHMNMPPWYGRANLIEKVDEKLFKLNTSYATTCELEKPHYRLEARTIKVYLNDRVTAWNAFFYVGEAPIMYIPYYNHPLKDNLPQVNIIPGHNDEWGAYALTSWRYYFHPDSKGHVHLDYRTKRGVAEGLDYKYKMDKFGDGYLRTYYLHDAEPGTDIPDERWRVQLRHKWDVDQHTFAEGEFHKLSDKDFIKDFFYKEEYEQEHQPPTYITLSGSQDNYSLSLLYQEKPNDFFTVTERRPEAKLDIRKLKLLDHMDLYYANQSSVVMLNQSYANDVPGARAGDSYDATRIDTYNELSYPLQLFGFLSLNPYVGMRETFYSEDASGNDNVTRYVFNTGLDMYTRFYKIYDFETDYLGLDIHDIRHLIIPSAQYVHIREPNIEPRALRQFDEIDNIRQKDAIELAIEHKLQTKRTGRDGKKYTFDLLTFIASSQYIFKDDFGEDNRLMDIDYDLEVRPYDWMFIEANAKLNRNDMVLDIFNADMYVDKGEDLRLGLGYRYERHENSQATGQLTYRINKDWKFNIYERYELQEKTFEQQEYTLIKDLHCWTGELTCRIEDEKDYTFWLIFRLKAFPDIPFFFRTTYRGPSPGSRYAY